jgi:hypothetical protein
MFSRRVSKITNLLNEYQKEIFPIGFDISDGSYDKIREIDNLIALREEIYDEIYFLENIIDKSCSKSMIIGIYDTYKEINEAYDNALSFCIHLDKVNH